MKLKTSTWLILIGSLLSPNLLDKIVSLPYWNLNSYAGLLDTIINLLWLLGNILIILGVYKHIKNRKIQAMSAMENGLVYALIAFYIYSLVSIAYFTFWFYTQCC